MCDCYVEQTAEIVVIYFMMHHCPLLLKAEGYKNMTKKYKKV